MAGIAEPIVEAFAELFNGFGLPMFLANLIASLTVIGTLFLVFISITSGFGISDSGKSYLFIVFFIGIAVLGLIPMWTIVIMGLLGIMFVFYKKIAGADMR